MKLLSILAAFFVLSACNSNTRTAGDTKSDSTTSPTVGADADEHGCRASAGYQWSKLKEQCTRVFEEGIKLDPREAITDKTMVAFIIFNDNNTQAEVFIPSDTSSVILQRKSEHVASWNNGDWHLELAGANYILKKKGVPQYSN